MRRAKPSDEHYWRSLSAKTWMLRSDAAITRAGIVTDEDLVANVFNPRNTARRLTGGNFLILGGDSTTENNSAIDYKNFDTCYRPVSDRLVYVEF